MGNTPIRGKLLALGTDRKPNVPVAAGNIALHVGKRQRCRGRCGTGGGA